MLRKLLLILSLVCLVTAVHAAGRMRYNVQIDFKKAYISGICIMQHDDDTVKASIVNEFGVSALDFTYDTQRQKVKIVNLMPKMNHWYIRRVLKRDLKQVMPQLLQKQDVTTYTNDKYNIRYTFTPANETPE